MGKNIYCLNFKLDVKRRSSWWWRWWRGMEKEIFMPFLSICYIGCLSVWVGLTQSVWLLNRRRWINFFFPEKYKIRKHLKTILKYLCFVYKMHNKNNNMNIYFIMCVIIVIAIHLTSIYTVHTVWFFLNILLQIKTLSYHSPRRGCFLEDDGDDESWSECDGFFLHDEKIIYLIKKCDVV